MKKIRQPKTKRQKAQAMVVSFIYISIVSLMAVYLMSYAHNLHSLVAKELKHSQAFYAGEAAMIRAMTECYRGATVTSSWNLTPMSISISTTSLTGGTRRIRAVVSNWQ